METSKPLIPKKTGSALTMPLRTISALLHHRDTPTMSCVILLFIFNQFSFCLLQVPRVQLLEKLVCRKHHLITTQFEPRYMDDQLCRTSEVQSELATILGLKMAFDAIPGILTATYFGGLADKHGRKPIVMLAFVGELLALLWMLAVCYLELPIITIYFSSLGLLLGGGQRIFLSMLFSIIADTVASSVRTRFMYLNPGIAAVAAIVAPLAAERMLAVSEWLPFQTVLVLSLFDFLIILALPGATPKSPYSLVPISSSPDEARESTELDQAISPEHIEATQQQDSNLSQHILDHLTEDQPSSSSLSPLFTKPLIVCYIIASLKRIAFTSQDFVYQYVSRTFHWSLKSTAQLQLAKAIGATIILIFLLPIISTIVIRSKIAATEKVDLSVLRICALLAIFGPLLLWLSSSTWQLFAGMVLWGLGEGMEPVLQGICAFLVDSNYTARMFTTVARLDLLSKLVGGPLMAQLLLIKRNGKVIAEGLCFPTSSVLFGFVAILTWLLRTDKQALVSPSLSTSPEPVED